ncbi:hypothetical protein P280DRAFT_480117 [Massarina eburnea CBS 473.64]|uniref:Uncharacterized protein n=1 Tax=Massarina eburnea CBS 473.64 TaxID=1395130 RepID=A0A6A6S0L1_9PLEO|nr:hypothetical protein P280DRAFT_480117 [Massarina eburnea CBS 473.64]
MATDANLKKVARSWALTNLSGIDQNRKKNGKPFDNYYLLLKGQRTTMVEGPFDPRLCLIGGCQFDASEEPDSDNYIRVYILRLVAKAMEWRVCDCTGTEFEKLCKLPGFGWDNKLKMNNAAKEHLSKLLKSIQSSDKIDFKRKDYEWELKDEIKGKKDQIQVQKDESLEINLEPFLSNSFDSTKL